MSYQVACPSCQGVLMVETPGVVVACPHCSIHLTPPANPAAPAPEPTAPVPQPTAPAPQPTAPAPQPIAPAPQVPTFEAALAPVEPAVTQPVATQPVAPEVTAPAIPEPAPLEPAPFEPAAFEPAVVTEPPMFEPAAEDSEPQFSTDAAPAAALEAAPLKPVSARSSTEMVSKKLFVFVLSYASAMTIIVIILLMQGTGSQAHNLESLPDIKPPMVNNKIGFHLVPNDTNMAPGHTLELGDEQRFGSLKVTAYKVTKEPIEFVHFSGNGTRDPSNAVYKLWLRFENVSDDQVFAPLDRELTLMRKGDGSGGLLRSNTFLCSAETKADNEGKLLVYDLPLKGSWDFRDCPWVQTDTSAGILQPGEVIETYIPTVEEGVDQMIGDLVWRVQFRKGYNRRSKRGVTTVIEVTFNSDELTAPETST